jgi:hypothetical protein
MRLSLVDSDASSRTGGRDKWWQFVKPETCKLTTVVSELIRLDKLVSFSDSRANSSDRIFEIPGTFIGHESSDKLQSLKGFDFA